MNFGRKPHLVYSTSQLISNWAFKYIIPLAETFFHKYKAYSSLPCSNRNEKSLPIMSSYRHQNLFYLFMHNLSIFIILSLKYNCPLHYSVTGIVSPYDKGYLKTHFWKLKLVMNCTYIKMNYYNNIKC